MGDVFVYKASAGSELRLPYVEEGIRAGFPSPAQDYLDETIDLNRDIIHHKESTFYARAVGDSLCEANVHEGDILVIDKSLTPLDGDMAVCCVEGEFTLKFIERHSDYWLLKPANPVYKPIRILPNEDFTIWGIVTHVIHKIPRGK